MLERFVRLCEIASPTGEEREVADAVLTELRGLGVDVAEDGSAGPARAGAGNLIARVEATTGQVVYRVHAIVLQGEGSAAEIATARLAHRDLGVRVHEAIDEVRVFKLVLAER